MEAAKNISHEGIEFIKRREGFSPRAYPDAGGLSIGYGCYLREGTAEYDRYAKATITEAEASMLMMSRLEPIVAAINSSVKVPLSQGEVDALASFAYNVGLTAFRQSTLLRMINAGDKDGAAKQFGRWDKSGGKTLTALTQRRQEEADLFAEGVYA